MGTGKREKVRFWKMERGSWMEVVIHERKMRSLTKDTHALVLVSSLA